MTGRQSPIKMDDRREIPIATLRDNLLESSSKSEVPLARGGLGSRAKVFLMATSLSSLLVNPTPIVLSPKSRTTAHTRARLIKVPGRVRQQWTGPVRTR